MKKEITIQDLWDKFDEFVANNNLEDGILYFESYISSVYKTDDKATILSFSFSKQTLDEIVIWIMECYEACTKEFQPKCFYFEMNEFDINTDCWYVDCFCYKEEYDDSNIDFLCYYNWCNFNDQIESFIFNECESIQKIYELDEWENKCNKWSCSFLINIKFMKLVRDAHQIIATQISEFKNIPILSTSHEYDIIYLSKI